MLVTFERCYRVIQIPWRRPFVVVVMHKFNIAMWHILYSGWHAQVKPAQIICPSNHAVWRWNGYGVRRVEHQAWSIFCITGVCFHRGQWVHKQVIKVRHGAVIHLWNKFVATSQVTHILTTSWHPPCRVVAWHNAMAKVWPPAWWFAHCLSWLHSSKRSGCISHWQLTARLCKTNNATSSSLALKSYTPSQLCTCSQI